MYFGSNPNRIEPKNAVALFHVGLIHERAERLPQAYNAYQAVVAEQPDYPAAQVRLGILALFRDDLDVAEKAADAIKRFAPEDPDGLALRAAVLLRHGNLEEAYETADKALAVDPANENAVAVQVGVLMAQQRPDDALAHVDQTIVRRTDSVPLRLLKVAVLEQQGDAKGVARAFEELLEREPTNLRYRLALANYHQEQGDLAAAETVLRTALEQGLDEIETIAAIVRLVHRLKGFEEAESELKRLIAAAPADRARQLLLADLHLQNDDSDAAEAVLDAIIGTAPDSDIRDDALMRSAQLRLGRGDDAGAAALADIVLERSGLHRTAHLVKGVVALRARDADEVIRRARTALREEPDWPPGLRLLADGHLLKGERDLAIDALSALVTANVEDTRSAALLAQLLAERGDLDAALKIWDRVVQSGTDPATALRARAAIAIRQGQWSTAEVDIQRLGELQGQEAVAAVLAGNLRLAQARFDESREWFLRAEGMQPQATDPMIGVVHAHLGKNDVEGALAYLRERVEQRPEDAVAHEVMGELLARDGKAREAEAAFRKAIGLQPDWLVPYRQLGALLVGRGAGERAAEVYEAAIATAPTESSLYLDLGAAHLTGDRVDAAMAAFERALAVDPANDIAANNWAALVADYYYQDETRLARALSLAQRFRTSENPFFLDTLGWLHYREGDHAMALTFIERAGTVGGDGPQFYYHRGMALYRIGELERAMKDLEKAVAGDVDYPGRDEAKTTLEALKIELAEDQPAG